MCWRYAWAEGRPPYRERKEAECGVALPLDFQVEPDDGDPDHYALVVAQAGLGMPDRDYYLGDAAAMRTARAEYRRYLAATLALAGVDDADAADRLLAFETRIAQVSWTAGASRDAQRTYNPLSLDRAGPTRWRRSSNWSTPHPSRRCATCSSSARCTATPPWTARNLDAFYPAFGVEPADRLYLKPAERVRIW